MIALFGISKIQGHNVAHPRQLLFFLCVSVCISNVCAMEEESASGSVGNYHSQLDESPTLRQIAVQHAREGRVRSVRLAEALAPDLPVLVADSMSLPSTAPVVVDQIQERPAPLTEAEQAAEWDRQFLLSMRQLLGQPCPVWGKGCPHCADMH